MKKGINIEERSVVIPGDVLATGMDHLPGYGTHRVNEEIRSSLLGLMDVKGSVIKVIPLKGTYIPKRGDKVIGKVVEIGHNTWSVNINAPATATISIAEATNTYIELGEDLSRYYAIGDYVYSEIISVGKDSYTKLRMKDRMFKKLDTGMILNISPVKVPRVIGKKGSMVKNLKDETGCLLIIGQNGVVWIKGPTRESELLAVKAIKYVVENAHLTGLTDAIKEKIQGWKK
jgi:exosome complex component RRP4